MPCESASMPVTFRTEPDREHGVIFKACFKVQVDFIIGPPCSVGYVYMSVSGIWPCAAVHL